MNFVDDQQQQKTIQFFKGFIQTSVRCNKMVTTRLNIFDPCLIILAGKIYIDR